MTDTEKMLREAEQLAYDLTGERIAHYDFETKRLYLAIVDEALNLVMVPEMPVDELFVKSGGLYKVRIEDRMGYVDEKGKFVIRCIYEVADPFSDSGLAFVITPEGRAGYINKANEMVITLPEGIVDGGIFEHGLSFISDGETYTFINEKGEEVFGEKFLFTDGFAKNGLAIVEDENNIFKAIDTKGNVLFELPKGISAEGFHENDNAAVIKKKKKYGVIDSKGNMISKCIFDDIIISKYDNRHMIKYGRNWGVLREDGTKFTEVIFKNPTGINKQGYFATYIDEKSELAGEIKEFSKSSLYVFKLDEDGAFHYSTIVGAKRAEISAESPVLTLTYPKGIKVMHEIEKGKNNTEILSYAFSSFYKGEAAAGVPSDMIEGTVLSFENWD